MLEVNVLVIMRNSVESEKGYVFTSLRIVSIWKQTKNMLGKVYCAYMYLLYKYSNDFSLFLLFYYIFVF